MESSTRQRAHGDAMTTTRVGRPSDSSTSASVHADPGRPARTYHFPAALAAGGDPRTSGAGVREWDLMSRGLGNIRQSSSTDRVNLDLSFDFESQGGEFSQAGHQSKSVDSGLSSSAEAGPSRESASSTSTSPARPRGMSDTMSSPSSTRKRPPKPLSFLKNSERPQPNMQSTFSPDTARLPDQVIGDDEPLPITPLSATRRGQASKLVSSLSSSSSSSLGRRERGNSLVGSQPPSDPPSTPLPPLPNSANSIASSTSLVLEQRRARAMQQLQSRKDRDSFVPAVPSLTVASTSRAGASAKTPLDQTFPVEQPTAPRKTRSKGPHAERMAGISRLLGKASSSKLAPPNAVDALGLDLGLKSPTPQSVGDTRSPRSLVKSPDAPTVDLPSFGSQSQGLELLATVSDTYPSASTRYYQSSSPTLPELTEGGSSPSTACLSTPGTVSSSIFEPALAGPPSESSKATSLESLRMSGSNKFFKSSLSSDWLQHKDEKTLPMGTTIREEPLEESRQAKAGLPRSETAEWIERQRQDFQRNRNRQETGSSYESASSAPSIHPLIVSTSSSVDDAACVDGILSDEARRPWARSPMLLQTQSDEPVASEGNREGDGAMLTSDSGIGLGLFLESQPTLEQDNKLNSVLTIDETRTADSAKSIQSSVVVDRHEVVMDPVALPERPKPAFVTHDNAISHGQSSSKRAMASSPSLSSSVEGFSMNVTQPLPGAAQQKDQRRPSLFSHRFFSAGSSSKQSEMETPRSPPIRSLTLVDRQGQQEDERRSNLRRHSLAYSGAAFAAAMGREEADPAEDASAMPPNSAPLPSVPAFPSSTAVPTAFERSKRSSKHVRRVSRLQYIADHSSGKVLVNLPEGGPPRRASVNASGLASAGATEADRLAALAGLKSPRPAPSPSGNTPDMVYGHPRSRFSWGYAPRNVSTGTVKILETPEMEKRAAEEAQSPASPSSPWLDFEEDGRGLRRTRERYEALVEQQQRQQPCSDQSTDANVNAAAAAAAATSNGAISNATESDADSGLRRRSALEQGGGHRYSSSVQPTATIRPFAWKDRSNPKRSSVHIDIVAGDDGAKLGQVVTEEKSALRKLKLLGDLPPPQEETRPMSIFVPLAALQEHLRRRNLEGRQQRQELEEQGLPTVHTQHQDTLGQPKAMLAAGSHLLYSSGRLLDTELTSRTLFFAGFLGMPWLWLIGGWWLANDGLMLTPGAQQVKFWTHEESMQEVVPLPSTRQDDARRDQGVRASMNHARLQQQQEPTRLSTIYSVDETHGQRAEHETTMPTLYESDSRTSAMSESVAMMTAASSPSLNGQRAPRTLLASSSDKIPGQLRKSMSSLLNPHPAVELFHSPVRSVPISVSVNDDKMYAAGSVASSADDSGLELTSAGDLDEDEASARERERQVALTSARLQQQAEEEEHMSRVYRQKRARLSNQAPAAFAVKGHEDVQPVASYAMMPAHARPNALERLAQTERFVLMNRFMAVVSTLAAFAGLGIALNAVAMNF